MAVDEEPHLLQVFLSRRGHGVFEVSVVPPTRHLTCTCPGFANRRRCKHIDYVRNRLNDDGGYEVVVSDAAAEALPAARQSPASWREFVHRYTTPEVL